MAVCIYADLREKKSIKHLEKNKKLKEIPVESLTKACICAMNSRTADRTGDFEEVKRLHQNHAVHPRRFTREESKHLEKIKKLKEIPVESLTKVEPPLKYFATDKTLSIGNGSNGTSVFVGIMEDGSEVAVKRMLICSCETPAENEKKILRLIDTEKSPFIVGYRHFFKDSTFIYLAVDLCEETLKEYVSFKSTEYLQQHGLRMIKEIFTGLAFLHNQGVLHRDLKPSNVLVDVDGHIKLADFGISRVLNDDETTHLTDAKGTRGWMAREVIETLRDGGRVHFKKKSDVQVGGMIAHFILTKGGHPFGDSFDRMSNIVKGNPVDLRNIDGRDDRSFVSWLISHNIDDRPFANEALSSFYLRALNFKTKLQHLSSVGFF